MWFCYKLVSTYNEFGCNNTRLQREDSFAPKLLTAMLKSSVTKSTFLQRAVFFASICSL